MKFLIVTFFFPISKEIFEKMDWDKNGTISPIEFKSYLASLKKGEELNAREIKHVTCCNIFPY